MKKILSLFALAVAFGATAASADPLMKYNYLDVSYQWNDTKGSQGVTPTNGVDTRLSISPFEYFALEGGYNYAQGDFTKTTQSQFNPVSLGSINYNTWTYGVLGYYHICPGFDILGRVGGAHYNVNTSVSLDTLDETISEDATLVGKDRVYAGIGTRYLLLDTLEVDGNITYQNGNPYKDTAVWTYSGTALYTLLENVALKADAGIDNDSTVVLGAGIRLAM